MIHTFQLKMSRLRPIVFIWISRGVPIVDHPFDPCEGIVNLRFYAFDCYLKCRGNALLDHVANDQNGALCAAHRHDSLLNRFAAGPAMASSAIQSAAVAAWAAVVVLAGDQCLASPDPAGASCPGCLRTGCR